MNKKSITDFNVNGKKVLVRCDFNVPVRDGVIINSARIMASLKTIQYLINEKAKVILVSHFGRPKGKPNSRYSLEFVAKYLEATIGQPVLFADDNAVIGEQTKALVKLMKDGDVLLLQNTRFHNKEEENDLEFSKELASLGDIFINDAFGTAHRSHCSTVGIANYLPSGAGFLLKREIDILDMVLNKPRKPFVAILGGSKVSDKIGVINNLIDKVDFLIIGGGMMFTFYAAMDLNIGESLLEKDKIYLAKGILEKAKNKGIKILLPEDVVIADSFSNDAYYEIVYKEYIKDNMMGLDIGPKSVKQFRKVILEAKTIFWNGPMGVFEMSNFSKGTFGVATAMSESKGMTVVGGGDSATAVDLAGLANQMTHISTGGGASLEFIEGKELPGIAALEDQLRSVFICGNWKMNTNIQEGIALLRTIMDGLNGRSQKVKVAICPPFTYLEHFKAVIKNSPIRIGAQNVHEKDSGAFTGEISVSMLADLKIDYCIIGHSERRQFFAETDKKINLKAKKLLKYFITPIICCGEPLEVRNNCEEKKYVASQLIKVFEGIKPELAKEIIVAYEPIWAIGTGKTATKEQAEAMCSFIRKTLEGLNYPAEKIIILYGGSVNSKNVQELLSCENIDGALVGGASLKGVTFLDIIESASQERGQ